MRKSARSGITAAANEIRSAFVALERDMCAHPDHADWWIKEVVVPGDLGNGGRARGLIHRRLPPGEGEAGQWIKLDRITAAAYCRYARKAFAFGTTRGAELGILPPEDGFAPYLYEVRRVRAMAESVRNVAVRLCARMERLESEGGGLHRLALDAARGEADPDEAAVRVEQLAYAACELIGFCRVDKASLNFVGDMRDADVAARGHESFLESLLPRP